MSGHKMVVATRIKAELAELETVIKRATHLLSKGVDMFLHVTEATYLKEYQLRLTFDDNVIKDVDLKEELYGEIFEPLKEIDFFRKVAINPDTGTVEWPNGADFAPEFLYEAGYQISKSSESQTPQTLRKTCEV